MRELKSEPIKPKYQQRNNRPAKCLWCRFPLQKGHRCSNSGVICSKCGRAGHFARTCRANCDATADNLSPGEPGESRGGHHYHKSKFEKVTNGNNDNATQISIDAQKRYNYYHDFYNVYFYYRHTQNCSNNNRKNFQDKLSAANNNDDKFNFKKSTRSQEDTSNSFKKSSNFNNKNSYGNIQTNNNNEEQNGQFWRRNDEDKNNNRSDFTKRPTISKAEAVKMKEKANEMYINAQYDSALSEYTKLIKFFPNNEIYYSNRSACFMMMGNMQKALNDARKCVTLNPSFLKGHYRVIKCTMATGKIAELETRLSDLEKINPTDEILVSERKKLDELNQHLKSEKDAQKMKLNASALRWITKCIEICPYSAAYKLRKAQYLAYLERYDEADAIANEILAHDETNVHAKYILSIHMYHVDLEKAVNYLESLLRDAPYYMKAVSLHKKASHLFETKRKGNEAFKQGDYAKAHQLYNDAMKIDPRNKKVKMQLHYNMAQVNYKFGLRVRTIRDCTKALEIDENYVKALARRGTCYMEFGEYEKATEDLQKCCRLDPSDEYKKLLEEVKRQQEEAERKERERKQREEEERRKREEERRQREEERRRREEERKRKEEESRKRQQDEYERWREEFDRRWKERFYSGNQSSGSGRSRSEERGHHEEGEQNSRRRQPRDTDYHGILGVSKHATVEEIKVAYRKLAKLHHPDRHSNASVEVRKEHERKMKLITQARRELMEAERTGFKFQK